MSRKAPERAMFALKTCIKDKSIGVNYSSALGCNLSATAMHKRLELRPIEHTVHFWPLSYPGWCWYGSACCRRNATAGPLKSLKKLIGFPAEGRDIIVITGIVNPKMKILSSFTHPHVVPNPYVFLSPRNHTHTKNHMYCVWNSVSVSEEKTEI